jgi:hypothetical protein
MPCCSAQVLVTETACEQALSPFLTNAAGRVLPLKMVDKSTSPPQTHFRPVFCDLAVQRGLHFPE